MLQLLAGIQWEVSWLAPHFYSRQLICYVPQFLIRRAKFFIMIYAEKFAFHSWLFRDIIGGYLLSIQNI